MRRKEPVLLADLLPEVLKSNGMSEHLINLQVKRAWQRLLPETLQHYVTGVEIESRVLTVRVSSAALRNELFLNRRSLIEQLNAQTSPNAVSKIVISH